jgi:hypothetical protein
MRSHSYFTQKSLCHLIFDDLTSFKITEAHHTKVIHILTLAVQATASSWFLLSEEYLNVMLMF